MCAAGAAKLHRSGMVSLSLRHRQRSVEIKALVSAAPTELGRETWVVAATNMAFLTELAPLALPKMCIKHSNALRLWEWERRLESGKSTAALQDAGAQAQTRTCSGAQSASEYQGRRSHFKLSHSALPYANNAADQTENMTTSLTPAVAPCHARSECDKRTGRFMSTHLWLIMNILRITGLENFQRGINNWPLQNQS